MSTFGATSVTPGGNVSSNSTVKEIQTTLNSRYGAGLTADGKYGSLTHAGLVKGLQKEIGVTVDGKFGPNTKAKCPTHKLSDKGNTVWVLQALLYASGYHPNGLDSTYGNGVYTAVRNFQSANGLTSDGIAGPNTFEALCLKTPGSNASVSSEGIEDIADIQSTLNIKYGADLVTDGKYGPLTRIALVKGAQYELGVAVDGIFGPKSKVACPVLQRGSSGNLVWLTQSMLFCLNYYINGVDGKFGEGTESTVMNYQHNNSLSADGKAGPNTLESLFAKVNTASPGGDSIRDAQRWLNVNYGSGLQIDGLYGPLTREALIMALQEEVGVTIDGKFGPKTKAACPVLLLGSSGNTVYILQAGLICRQIDPNGFDGKYGSGTYGAVRSLQAASAITVDGKAGPNTLEALLTGAAVTGSGDGSSSSGTVTGISGKTIFIDAGHGGSDPGACNNIKGLKEKDFTLKLVKYQKEYFEAKGYSVITSRDTDVSLSLEQRSARANATNASLFISNHVNAATDPTGNGVETYHGIGSTNGKVFAGAVCKALSNFFHNRGAKTRASADQPGKDYYHVIRETKMTALLIEHGFISHNSDSAKLSSDTNLREMARLTVETIDNLWPKSGTGNDHPTNPSTTYQHGAVRNPVTGEVYPIQLYENWQQYWEPAYEYENQPSEQKPTNMKDKTFSVAKFLAGLQFEDGIHENLPDHPVAGGIASILIGGIAAFTDSWKSLYIDVHYYKVPSTGQRKAHILCGESTLCNDFKNTKLVSGSPRSVKAFGYRGDDFQGRIAWRNAIDRDAKDAYRKYKGITPNDDYKYDFQVTYNPRRKTDRYFTQIFLGDNGSMYEYCNYYNGEKQEIVVTNKSHTIDRLDILPLVNPVRKLPADKVELFDIEVLT